MALGDEKGYLPDVYVGRHQEEVCDGLEHLEWARDFLNRFDGRYKKFK